MMLISLYSLLSLIAVPSLIIVAETMIKSFIAGIACIFGLDIEIEIESANYIAKLFS